MALNLNLSLLRPWHDHAQRGMKIPYVTAYCSAKKELRYIAAEHVIDTHNATTQLIAHQVQSFHPNSLIIEAPSEGSGVMPKWFYEYASHGIGEVAYALDLAIRNNINCVTGEPSQLQIIDGLEQQEFTKEDFLSWHICSMLKHRYKYKTLDTDNIEGAIQEFRKNLLRQIPIAESNCNKLNFYNWYHEKLHTSFHIEHLASLDGSPSKNNTSNYLQKIMQAIDNVREPNIVNTIHQQLQSNDKVLVIYGAAHEFKHKIVLQNLMSQHTITSLNP